MGGLFGGGPSAPDNSAYERQLEEQRQATAKAEAETARKKKESDDAFERQKAGRQASLMNGAEGDDDESSVKKKALLGQGAK